MSSISEASRRRSDAGGAEREKSPLAIEAKDGERGSERRLPTDVRAREPSLRREGIATAEFALVPEPSGRERFARWLD